MAVYADTSGNNITTDVKKKAEGGKPATIHTSQSKLNSDQNSRMETTFFSGNAPHAYIAIDISARPLVCNMTSRSSLFSPNKIDVFFQTNLILGLGFPS